MQLYGALTPWYHLVDPCDDHADEAETYRAALAGAVPGAKTLLDLGAGAGNNAWHLKRHFACTLVDVSEPMLALSRARNPDCRHVQGDLRTVRLGEQFDCVLVHDAIMYMTSEADLAQAAATAFLHTRPGGAAIITPDLTRETFRDMTEHFEADDGARALRGLEWSWDPDPDDTTFRTDFVLVLREGGTVRTVHDTHTEGLFPRATWERVWRDAGYSLAWVPRPLDEPGPYLDDMLLARRPA